MVFVVLSETSSWELRKSDRGMIQNASLILNKDF
jgi:hypothetical protein